MRSKETRNIPLLVADVFLLAVFLALTVIVIRHPGPLEGDVGIELAVQQALLPHRFVTAVIEEVSTLNFPTPAAITVSAVVVLLAALRRWAGAAIVAATAIAGDGSRYVVSVLVHRARPSGHGLRIVAALRDSYSFPSGHVTYAVAFFGLLLYLSFQVRSDVLPAVLWVVRAYLALIILLMPVSRMLEGEHWPSDVAGAAFFGGFWLLAAIQVNALVRRRSFPLGAER